MAAERKSNFSVSKTTFISKVDKKVNFFWGPFN